MKQDTYIRLMRRIKAKTHWVKVICTCNDICTKVVYVSFCLFILWLVLNRDERVIRVLCTTAISFLLVSIFRKLFDRQRPYEKFGELPVIPKDKRGNSFPSRHVFSAFVIAMAFLYVQPVLGIIFFLVSFAIAVFRVIGGVHYPSDVIVGAVAGILCGFVGIWLL